MDEYMENIPRNERLASDFLSAMRLVDPDRSYLNHACVIKNWRGDLTKDYRRTGRVPGHLDLDVRSKQLLAGLLKLAHDPGMPSNEIFQIEEQTSDDLEFDAPANHAQED